MEQALLATQLLYNLLGGLGIFFLGIGVLWFVSVYKEKKVGSFGTTSAFSFYPTKNLGAYGDGGMILTDDINLYEKIVMLRQYGWKDRYKRYEQYWRNC